ncbi:MAG: hypothetical protein QF681_12955, partial [Vicinamibacterales bacterium]|nr:hypothetical protein [Vicinamibacterales bacterium]
MTENGSGKPEPRNDAPKPAADTVEVPAPRDRAAETTAPHEAAVKTLGAFRARLRGWTHGRPSRYVRWAVGTAAVVVAVAIVAVVTIDLGPSLRASAEQAASNQLDREVTIGSISARLMPGEFIVEDLVIGGLKPGDRPFLTAERIFVSTRWLPLLNGEFLVDSAEMINWRMLAESFPDGTQSFPAFVQRREDGEQSVEAEAPANESSESDEGRRFVATLEYMRAHQGEFVLDDHGANFGVICANLDLTITKIVDYRGHASCSGGSILIGDYEPMWMNMATDFELDGAQVHLTRVNVETDGASTVLDGDADLANLPEMTFELESDIDTTRMREIFFADHNFTTSGEAHFTGTFHKFEGGYDLRGTIASPVFGLETSARQFRFPKLDGQLVWQPDRFDMWDITSNFLDGRVRADLSTFGLRDPWQGTFDARYEEVDVSQLARVFELRGLQPVSRASGRNLMQWPMKG